MDPLLGGWVTCSTRADWHRGARSPDPGNSLRSGRNAFTENLSTHQGSRGCLAQGFGSPSRHFYPDRLKSVKAAGETLERCRCGGIDQEMSGTIPMIGAVLPSCSAL